MAAREVEFRNVSFTAPGGQSILRDVSFSVSAGETVALLGRSGSGKTTLLRTVNAMVRPTSGAVLVGGLDVAGQDVIALRRSMGYVIQETGLFPHRRIAGNVGMPLEIAGAHENDAAYGDKVASALHRVGLDVKEFAQRYPRELSGGQRQRVGVARALVTEPGVLLMDEPFGALDPLTRAEMQTMVRDLLRRVGVTTLMVTHDLEEALYLADRVVMIEAGRVVADLPSDEVRASSNEAVKAYMAAVRHA
jgi:osmoprotectant transport system ATP-binding protein